MARKKRKPEPTPTSTPEETVSVAAEDMSMDEQSGDLQGLSGEAGADSQSVRELAAEGQSYEAALVSAIENAPPADAGELHTHEVPEDDVPSEYTDRDPDEPKD